MCSNQDEVTIKLHTSATGRVWYSKGVSAAVNSGQTVDEFMLSSVIAGMGLRIRVLGTAQNAELISSLYLRRHKGEVRSVEVAGPQSLTREEAAEPKLVLLKMRSITLAPACGGWHATSMLDYPTYAMLARMQRTNFVFDDMASTYYHLHPAYKALSFIPTLAVAETAKLLITIVDPRWFVDLRLPERTSKLELYLGLTPKIQARVAEPQRLLVRARELRCANVLACWKTVDPAIADIAAPANFLYRIYHAAGGGAKGDLRASQAFVCYLRHNWLAGLEGRVGVKDGLFAPELFFKLPAEIVSYTQHMATTKLT